MKFLMLCASLFAYITVNAQTAFHNFGDIQMHENAAIGFHTDLINDGNFENNEGLAGFYSSDETRYVSGNNRAAFYDVEIDVSNDLELETSVAVENDLDFINGKVITPRTNTGLTSRNDQNISLDFLAHNIHAGQDDDRHVDGYASTLGTEEFVFPIGDDDRLRPMTVSAQAQTSYFKGAYFFEDPNTPSEFTDNFDTTEKQFLLENISNLEFWDLNGSSETVVTLTWDEESNIEAISSEISTLRVVGWSTSEKRWLDLGGENISGDLFDGQLSSLPFVPDNYEIITIGSHLPSGEVLGENFLISPNEDNVNDFLVFDGLELYRKNKLSIFNRWGNTVLEIEDYDNDWNGISNGRLTVLKDNKLPVGTYFYILHFGNDSLDRELKGWVYINR